MMMNSQKSPHAILQQIAQIQKMERGKLSIIRQSAAGPFYKLQARENGKNRTRYVPRHHAPAVQEALQGFARFQALSDQYAQLIIDKTRAEITSSPKKKIPRPKFSSPRRPKSPG